MYEAHHIEYEDGYGRLVCEADEHADCRMSFTCDCEQHFGYKERDGVPYHLTYNSEEDEDEWHEGKWGKYCSIQDWFDEGDCVQGTVKIPVDIEWEGDHFIFKVGPVVSGEPQ